MCLCEFDGIKTFLKMQKKDANVLAQQDVTKKWNKHDKLEDAVLTKIELIPGGASDPKELATLKKSKKLRLELSKKMDSQVLKSFTLYQQMLSHTLRSECDNIVQEH